MNPYVWQMVNASTQEHATELERAMGLEHIKDESLSDLHRAGSRLLFITGILGKGAFAVVCKAFPSTHPIIDYALKLEATGTEGVPSSGKIESLVERLNPKRKG